MAVTHQTDLQVLRLVADMSALVGGAARRNELVEYTESLGHSTESTYEILTTLDRTHLVEAWMDNGVMWLRVTPAGMRALDDPPNP